MNLLEATKNKDRVHCVFLFKFLCVCAHTHTRRGFVTFFLILNPLEKK